MNEIFAAATSISITPSEPVPLAGYAGRKAHFTSIADSLEANAVRLRVGGDEIVLVTLDLLYAGENVTAHIEYACQQGEIGGAGVIVAASHTHFAPATDAALSSLGEVDMRYLTELQDALSALIERLAAETLEPVQLHHGFADARPWAVHRRLDWRPFFGGAKRIVMAPNPNGPIDECIHALTLETLNSRVIARLWRFGCHPVSFPNITAVSADFPGVVRSRLRRDDPQLPVLFFQGFSGDVRPRIKTAFSMKDWLRRVKNWLRRVKVQEEPRFPAVAAPAWHTWAERLAELVNCIQLQPLNGPYSVAAAETRQAGAALVDGANGKMLRIQKLSCGTLTFFSVNAEVASIRSDSLANDVWPISCAGDVIGYWPTTAQTIEGGYEGAGWAPIFYPPDAAMETDPDGLWASMVSMLK